MKNQHVFLFKLLFLCFFGAIGALISFLNLYLEQELGFSGAQIGLITSISMIFLVVITPLWGVLADKTGKYTGILKVSLIGTLVVGALYSQLRYFGIVLLVAILFEIIRAATVPMMELITTGYCEKSHYSFGKIRVYGSIGFMVVGMATGFFVGGLNVSVLGFHLGFAGFLTLRQAVFGAFLSLIAITLAITFLLPETAVEQKKDRHIFRFSQITALFKNKAYVFILIFTMLSNVVVDTAHIFSGLHLVTTLGATEASVGWLTFAAVSPELLLLPVSAVLMLKIGFKNAYIFGVCSMLLRMLIYTFVSHPAIFIIASALQPLSLILYVSGHLTFIRKVLDPNMLGLGFTVLASSMALSRAILTYLFGLIYDHVSSFTIFGVASVILIIPLVLAVSSKHLSVVGAQIKQSQV